MTNRDTSRTPRRSGLAGASAFQPPQPAAPAPEPQPRRPVKPTKAAKEKVGFYQDVDDAGRMRGAYRMTGGQEGDRSLSDFIQKAIMAEVERRERTYNGGKRFEALRPGDVPQGRPEGGGA